MNLKIAIILPSLAHKGPILIAQKIVNSNKDSSTKFKVLYFDDIVEVEFNCRCQQINFFTNINFDDFDLIHSHMLRPDLYVAYWTFLGKLKSVKKVSTIHQFIEHDLKGQHPYWKAKSVSKIWHMALKKQDLLITLNTEMYRLYKKKYYSKAVELVFNGIDTQEISNDYTAKINDFKKDRICLGSAARLTKNKGFDKVLKVLALDNNLCFVLFGDGPEKKFLLREAKRLDVSNQVLFLGKVNNAAKYFSDFDIFIMCSEKEGFPVSLLEAASLGIPSVCPDIEIFNSIFDKSEVSFFKKNNIDYLLKSIYHIDSNYNIFSKKIRSKYILKYTSEIMSENYNDLYKALKQD